jgi:hypothetical protein
MPRVCLQPWIGLALLSVWACSTTPAVDAGGSDVSTDAGQDAAASDSGALDNGSGQDATDGSTTADDGSMTTDDAGPVDSGPLSTVLGASLVDTHFRVLAHMRASIEMQLSGEPFAQLLNYNLNNFTRSSSVTDRYKDPTTNRNVNDPLGYVLAIETYEYSKQPMNNLSFESGAGLSLMYGPVLNPGQLSGAQGFTLLANRFQRFAAEAYATGDGTSPSLVVSPPPSNNPLNYYGWPGLWPVMAEFSSFDPTVHPMPGSVQACTLGGSLGYGTGFPRRTPLVANYECDYNSLNLPNRTAQVMTTLETGALGYVAWKQALWAINYWQTLHDTAIPTSHGITTVAPSDLPMVGQPGNLVVGQYPDPADPTGMTMLPGTRGTYLGDITLEGWQGLLMMEEIDNKSALLLQWFTSTDGQALSPVSSLQAIDYAYDSALRYFPAALLVTETQTATTPALANKYFPQPNGFLISDAESRLSTLSGLIGGYGEAFTFSDQNNSQVGGSVPFLATFDGDPFPQDNGMPDGENTLHDRALGILKIALVDLDRIHFDSNAKVLVDSANVTQGAVTRGTTVSAVEVGALIVALRSAFRALNSSLQLYTNDTPDALGAPGALDMAPLTGAPYSGTLQAHITDLIRDEADFLSTKLIDSNGAVANSYDLGAQHADASPTTLEAETAAIRGLLEAYLATSDQRYRDRAIQVYADLGARFWMSDVRCFRTMVGADSLMQYTPIRFGMLQGALRQYYKLVASTPGHQAEATELLARIKRTMKLLLNGWDDKNQDDRIQYPSECLGVGLEMGERALTGELGNPMDMGDRDKDCVREISSVNLPAALSAELDVSRR